jgi:hypothetical protein
VSNDDKSSIRKINCYQVDLRYACRVGKRDFVGTSAGWGWTTIYGLCELAEKAASQYRQGQPVTVYYDPGLNDTADRRRHLRGGGRRLSAVLRQGRLRLVRSAPVANRLLPRHALAIGGPAGLNPAEPSPPRFAPLRRRSKSSAASC